ncbi:MAG: UDP-N-acetylglucosamine--N-acetylmuramyl-(pentapeptide) pyrophosphoryl-undecaprenol N-acetylglucosamine transferase [Candidatus Sungiibacteriota bacterium]
MRILFAGGGTGGHFFPLLAVIREIKRVAEDDRILDLELFYMSPDNFGARLLDEEEVVRIRVLSGKWRRAAPLFDAARNMRDVLLLAVGAVQAVWNMFLIIPDIVFSKGGYGALPAVLAAILFRIPIIIHESDAIPGKVNQFSARFAARIGIAFPDAAKYFPAGKVALIGIPIRRRILGGRADDAREAFNIFSALPVIGVIGASQGAVSLNDTALGVIKELTEKYEVVHQTGEKNITEVEEEASVILEFHHKERYRAVGFLDETGMRDFYSVCNLIISRAGASSIFEIAAHGIPAIVVPLPHAAQNHQWVNAYAYAAAGAAVIMEEVNLTPHILLAEIKKLMDDAEKMKKMSEAARAFARTDSADLIAREILKLGVH